MAKSEQRIDSAIERSGGGIGDGADIGHGESGPVDTATIPDAEPPKRGGWPKGKSRAGSGNKGGDTGTGGTGGNTARTSQKEKAAPLDLSGISAALVGIHLGIAAMTKHDHWQMDEREADTIAKSIANVARHYPTIAKSQKLVDWAMLIQTVGILYVPRVLHSRGIMKENVEREKQGSLF